MQRLCKRVGQAEGGRIIIGQPQQLRQTDGRPLPKLQDQDLILHGSGRVGEMTRRHDVHTSHTRNICKKGVIVVRNNTMRSGRAAALAGLSRLIID